MIFKIYCYDSKSPCDWQKVVGVSLKCGHKDVADVIVMSRFLGYSKIDIGKFRSVFTLLYSVSLVLMDKQVQIFFVSLGLLGELWVAV